MPFPSMEFQAGKIRGVANRVSPDSPWNRTTKTLQDRPVLMLFLAALLCFAMWFYADRVWTPSTDIHFSELYSRWYGSRELLLHRRDPYSLAITTDIKTWLHPYRCESQPQTPQDEALFSYPLYLAFILAPTIGFSFTTVESIFRVALPVIVAATALLWIHALRWQVNRPIRGALVLLTLGSFPFMECIYLQQPALLAALLVAGSSAALSWGYLSFAGFLLALATIKPQLVVLFVPWLLLWAFSDLRRRLRFLRSFALTMAALLGGSQLVLPSWIKGFFQEVIRYQHCYGGKSILSLALTYRGALVVSAALVTALVVIGWKFRSARPDSMAFSWTSCLVLSTTVVIIPTMYPTAQVVLVPAVFLLLQHGSEIFGSRAQKLSSVAALCVIAWPAIGALAYLLLSTMMPIQTLRVHWLIPVSTVPVTPLMVLAALGLRAPAIFSNRTCCPSSASRR